MLSRHHFEPYSYLLFFEPPWAWVQSIWLSSLKILCCSHQSQDQHRQRQAFWPSSTTEHSPRFTEGDIFRGPELMQGFLIWQPAFPGWALSFVSSLLCIEPLKPLAVWPLKIRLAQLLTSVDTYFSRVLPSCGVWTKELLFLTSSPRYLRILYILASCCFIRGSDNWGSYSLYFW